MRAISNIVDVTNYVMVELGHPLHAFDADTISGGRLMVKRAGAGETLETLDGEQRTLTADDLIIYDVDGPTSMSGTMGGARSEVSGSTVNVLMEAASWDPPTIMHMSRRHGLMSEASTRFERGVDPNLTEQANARAAAMVVELGGGAVLEDVIDEIAVEIHPVQVDLMLADVERILGPGFSSDQVTGILDPVRHERRGVGPDRGNRADVSARCDQASGSHRGSGKAARLPAFRRHPPHRSRRRSDPRAEEGETPHFGPGRARDASDRDAPVRQSGRASQAGMDGHGPTLDGHQPASGGGGARCGRRCSRASSTSPATTSHTGCRRSPSSRWPGCFWPNRRQRILVSPSSDPPWPG